MVEVPHQLTVPGELENTVLSPGAPDPHKTITVREDAVQRSGPLGMISGTAPGVYDVAVHIHCNDLGPVYAANDPWRIASAADLDSLSLVATVHEPDDIHMVDMNAGHFLHAPAIWQRAGPERVYAEQRSVVLIHRQYIFLGLQTRACPHDEHHNSKNIRQNNSKCAHGFSPNR